MLNKSPTRLLTSLCTVDAVTATELPVEVGLLVLDEVDDGVTAVTLDGMEAATIAGVVEVVEPMLVLEPVC
jgi:hypothetical protein